MALSKVQILNFGLFDVFGWPPSPLVGFFHILWHFLIRMLPLDKCTDKQVFKFAYIMFSEPVSINKTMQMVRMVTETSRKCNIMILKLSLTTILESYIRHSYPMVPCQPTWYLMATNGTKWYLMVPNNTEWYWMVRNGTKWYRIVTNGTNACGLVKWRLEIKKKRKLRLILQFCPSLSEFTHLVVPRAC